MTEMIERVARAIYEYELEKGVVTALDGDKERLWFFNDGHYRRKARAAIRAMREPTMTMRAAGANAIPETYIAQDSDATIYSFATWDVWQTMIDKALEEGETDE